MFLLLFSLWCVIHTLPLPNQYLLDVSCLSDIQGPRFWCAALVVPPKEAMDDTDCFNTCDMIK